MQSPRKQRGLFCQSFYNKRKSAACQSGAFNIVIRITITQPSFLQSQQQYLQH